MLDFGGGYSSDPAGETFLIGTRMLIVMSTSASSVKSGGAVDGMPKPPKVHVRKRHARVNIEWKKRRYEGTKEKRRTTRSTEQRHALFPQRDIAVVLMMGMRLSETPESGYRSMFIFVTICTDVC